METRMFKVYAKADPAVALKVIPGHFATNHSHINYYIDLTTLKARQNEAQAAARLLAYIATPEFHTGGQLIFRDNMQLMVKDKNILLLLATATTGKTLNQSIECIEYYGGKISAINAIFSAVDKAHSIPVNAIFTRKDMPDYQTYSFRDCPLCQKQERVDAIVNTYGYSKL